jgi:hypothetical protein
MPNRQSKPVSPDLAEIRGRSAGIGFAETRSARSPALVDAACQRDFRDIGGPRYIGAADDDRLVLRRRLYGRTHPRRRDVKPDRVDERCRTMDDAPPTAKKRPAQNALRRAFDAINAV